MQKAIFEEMKKPKEENNLVNIKANSHKVIKTNNFLSSSMKEKNDNEDKININLFKMSDNFNIDKNQEKPIIKKCKKDMKQYDTPEMKKSFPKFFSPQKLSSKEGISLNIKLCSHNNDSQTTIGSNEGKESKFPEKKSSELFKKHLSIEDLLKSQLENLNEKNICLNFEKILSNFNEIYSNIETVSNSTLRLLVEIILNNMK